MRFLPWHELLQRLRSLPKWTVGLTIATPSIALIQGAVMLQDYRTYHGHAPFPLCPSRGIIVMKSEQESTDERPLRLLVIGDSLAAGVGVSNQGTPILPESIAKSLSQSLGGRAVRWTCIGTPGASASQILNDIFSLQHEPKVLEEKLAKWQQTKLRANKWWEERKKLQIDENNRIKEAHVTRNRIHEWWNQVKKDIHSFQSQVLTEESSLPENQTNEDHQDLLSNPDHGSCEYDVAVVLTGLNDLKAMFLPFMMPSNDRATISSEEPIDSPKTGLKEELTRILSALRIKMPSTEGKPDHTLHQVRRHPLVVFPALPVSPMPLCHQAPLSWFVVPLLQMIDNHKRRLADSFPNLVLFVEAPSLKSMKDLEDGLGPIVTSKKAEQVLLELTDVTQKANDRVKALMKEHYHRLTNDQRAEEKIELVYHDATQDLISIPASALSPGATLIAADNVHPNDEGYDFWGRHIAAAIIHEWKLHSSGQ
jgi:lysophospholipase L1-like esterase